MVQIYTNCMTPNLVVRSHQSNASPSISLSCHYDVHSEVRKHGRLIENISDMLATQTQNKRWFDVMIEVWVKWIIAVIIAFPIYNHAWNGPNHSSLQWLFCNFQKLRLAGEKNDYQQSMLLWGISVTWPPFLTTRWSDQVALPLFPRVYHICD